MSYRDAQLQIEKINYNGKDLINVYVDSSSSNGVLHFSHEISVSFIKKGTEFIFDSAWHCGVFDADWDSDEEESFEATFPGLLDRMRKEMGAVND